MSLYVDVEKELGGFHLNVKLKAGDETLALLGASGCGKSLTLKCIAGIERPDRGRIVLDDRVLFDSEKKIDLPPQARRTGLMFQSYALFPHMTVLENIRAGANRESDKGKRRAAVEAVVDNFGLKDLLNHHPAQLSGGQQQRVALARILVSAPHILLLDEPFSALDSHLRFRLEQEVREVIRRFGKTVLLVSHDRDEVFRMADSIAIMNDGRVETLGPKQEVFRAPGTRSGAILTGCKNISRAEPVDQYRVRALDWGLTLKLARPAEGVTAVGVRAHDVRQGEGENLLLCRVEEEIENPFSCLVIARPEGAASPIVFETDKERWRAERGQEIRLNLPPEAILPLRDA